MGQISKPNSSSTGKVSSTLPVAVPAVAAAAPALAGAHSLPGTYCARAAQLVPSPPPACWHLRASAAAGVDGERPRARPASASTRFLQQHILPQRDHFPQPLPQISAARVSRSAASRFLSLQAPPTLTLAPKHPLVAQVSPAPAGNASPSSRLSLPSAPPTCAHFCPQAPRRALPSAPLTHFAGSTAAEAIAANSPKLCRP